MSLAIDALAMIRDCALASSILALQIRCRCAADDPTPAQLAAHSERVCGRGVSQPAPLAVAVLNIEPGGLSRSQKPARLYAAIPQLSPKLDTLRQDQAPSNFHTEPR